MFALKRLFTLLRCHGIAPLPWRYDPKLFNPALIQIKTLKSFTAAKSRCILYLILSMISLVGKNPRFFIYKKSENKNRYQKKIDTRKKKIPEKIDTRTRKDLVLQFPTARAVSPPITARTSFRRQICVSYGAFISTGMELIHWHLSPSRGTS